MCVCLCLLNVCVLFVTYGMMLHGCFFVVLLCVFVCVLCYAFVRCVCGLICDVVWFVFCVCFVCLCVCLFFPNEPVRWDAPLKNQKTEGICMMGKKQRCGAEIWMHMLPKRTCAEGCTIKEAKRPRKYV